MLSIRRRPHCPFRLHDVEATLNITLSPTAAWGVLVVAGLLEAVWAIGLKYAEGFTRPVPTVVTVVALVASMWLLGLAARTLPIGTAYGVWVGIGATLAAIGGWRLFDEPMSAARVGFLVLLLVALAGLKLTATTSTTTTTVTPSTTTTETPTDPR